MTGFDSKRRIALDRLDDDDIQVYAQPEGKIMTEEEARTLEAMKYAASMGYPSSMLKDMFAPFTIKRDVAMAQPEQEPVGSVVRWLDGSLIHGWFGDPPTKGTLLYTAPPKREWVGLTEEEAAWCQAPTTKETWKRIESLLKEKNTALVPIDAATTAALVAEIKRLIDVVGGMVLKQGPDYERGFIDGMSKPAQSSVDKAVNRMAQPEQEPVAWMVYTQDGKSVYVTDNPIDIQAGQRALPLYAKAQHD